MIDYTCKGLSLTQRRLLRKYIRREKADMSVFPDAPISVETVQNIKKKQYSSLWYGGTVVNIKYKGWNFEICANGDICADLVRKDDPENSLLYVKDKRNGGLFGEEILPYIATDQALNSAICRSHPLYQLVLHHNNSWECFVIDTHGGFHDLMWCLDSDSIISAIAEVIANLEETVHELESVDSIPAAG